MAREHNCLLFMGQGKVSEYEVKRLHTRLDEAFKNLSAWQQGVPFTQEDTNQLDDLIRDIAAAICGREVSLGQQLPYPGKMGKRYPSDLYKDVHG